MKKKYKKIMLFLSLCLSLIIGLTVSSHAYYVNNDGNYVSENLFNINDVSSNSSPYSIQNNSLLIVNNNTSNVWATVNYIVDIESSSTYTFSCTQTERTFVYIFEFLSDSTYNIIRGDGQTTSLNVVETFTTSSNASYIQFSFYDSNRVGNTISNIMFNVGSSVLPWEPYGIWYSQTNYNEYGDNRYSVGFSDAIQYDSVSPVSMENLSECTYYVNGSSGSSSGWFERTFILNGSLVDSSGASEDDGFNTSYGLFSGSQDFVNFVLDDHGIHLTSETPSELGQESYIEFVLSRAYSSDNFSCTLGLAFTHLDCFNSSGALVYSFANDNSSIVNSNYVLSNVPLSNISVFKLYFNQDTVLDDSPVFLNISPLESAFNSGYLKGISDNSINYEYGRQKYKEGYEQGKLDTQNSSVIAGSNFQKLIWTIGSTPFESFKTIWNVDVMGLNISGIILGGLMALLVLYLIKKIWK